MIYLELGFICMKSHYIVNIKVNINNNVKLKIHITKMFAEIWLKLPSKGQNHEVHESKII